MKDFLGILLLACALWASSQNIDSLKQVLDQKKGTDRIDILHQLSRSTWLNYPSQALNYSTEALAISQDLQDSTRISQSLRHLGAVHYYEGRYTLSMEFNQRALDMALAIGDSSLINNGYNNVGLLNYNLGNYEAALEYFTRAQKIKNQINELYGLPTVINNIGLVYEAVADYETARKFFRESHALALEIADYNRVIYTQNNLGITYVKENQLDLARNYFDKALTLATERNNTIYGSVSRRGIGEILFLQGDYDSAFYYFEKSLTACQRIQDKRGVSETFYLLARLALKRGEEKQALDYLNQSNGFAEELKLRKQLLDNLILYAEIYENGTDLGSENMYLRNYINLRDSLYQDVVGHNLSLIPVKLKEEDDRQKFARQQAELRRKNSINRMYIVILIFAFPLMLFLIILARNNVRANKILKESNEELRSTQKLLITSEKMASLGVLTAGIGHEINNPLNFIKNGSEGLSKALKEKYNGADDFQPFFEAIQEGVKRASNVVKSMSQFTRVEVDMDASCSVHDIIENCLVMLNNNLRVKAEVVKNFTSESPLVKGNEGKLHQAFLNILSNAEQAIEKHGTITITTTIKKDKMLVSFSDTGIGIQEDHLIKISDPFFTTKAPGEGMGLGLFITYSIIEEHKGSIHITSDNRQGTEIVVELPRD